MTLGQQVRRLIRQPPKLQPEEQVIDEARVVRTTAFPRTYGGRIYVSDCAVYFAPDILNRIVGARPWCACASEVESFRVGERRRVATGQPIPELQIVTADGTAETFTALSDPDRIIAVLSRMVES